MNRLDGVPQVRAPRDIGGPPYAVARAMLAHQPIGQQLVIARKGRGLLRWDASLWEVRDIHGTPYPWMIDVGFGVIRRGALRKLRRGRKRS